MTSEMSRQMEAANDLGHLFPGVGHPDVVTVGLCGDMMMGQGVDQILAQSGDPRLSSWKNPLICPSVTNVPRGRVGYTW